MSEGTRQSTIDEEHLKVLSLGSVVSAVVCTLFSLFGVFCTFMGIMAGALLSRILETTAQPAQGPPPAFIGWVLADFGMAILLLTMGTGAAKFRAAWCVKHRTWRTFCMIIARINRLEFPYGTALGLFSLIVLGRDSVIQIVCPKTFCRPSHAALIR
jgi:hypothetical protein